MWVLKRKTLCATLIVLFLIFFQLQVFQAACIQLVEIKRNVKTPSIIYVPDDYPTIQDAINAANPGDTIVVREGTYYENLVVNVSDIVLRSEMGAEKTIIDGSFTGNVVEISANNVTIEGFTIRRSGTNGAGLYVKSSNNTIHGNNITDNGDGIILEYSSNNTIYGNNIENNEWGIHLYYSSNNTIYGNNIIDHESGTYLYYSSNNTIYGNNIENNVYGIDLWYSSNNTIHENNIVYNGFGILLGISSGNNVSFNVFVNDGLYVGNSFDSVVVGNLVNGKPLVYLEDAVNVEVVYVDAGQVVAVNSRNITIRNLEILNTDIAIEFWRTNESRIENCTIANNNYFGIFLGNSSGNTIHGNNIENNGDGIYIYASSNNTIHGNNITDNDFGGTYLYYSSNNTIYGNNIANNFWGIHLGYSDGNVIYLNNFIGNVDHVDPYSSVSSLSSPTPLNYTYNDANFTGYMGNYWDNYTGPDNDGDGIGDTPHQIDPENIDNYPLIKPIENYIVSEISIDVVPPVIGVPSLSPTEPVENMNVTVSVEVSDADSGVKNVTLWFRVNGGGWQLREMVPEEEGNVWRTEIPAQPAGTLVEYYIVAYDKAGNKAETSIYSYTVRENIPPTLQIESPINNSFVRGVVNISVSAYDPSGVNKVEFYIDGELVATDSAAPYTWNWNTTKSSDGTHTIEIKAYDTFNNVNSTKIIVNVDNTPPSISAVECPSEVEENVAVKINVTVVDAGSGVDEVILSYSVDGGETWVNLTATAKSGDVYEAAIPGQTAGTTVQFKIIAVDEAGNVALSQTYSYEVVSEEQPPEEETPLGASWTLIGGIGAVAAVIVVVLVVARRRG